MSDKIIVITPPDDILVDGVRILLVGLDSEQNQVVSNSLLKLDNLLFPVIVYYWNQPNSYEWLFDKNLKSNLVIFNAENETISYIIGYMAAMPNSYYFGNLKDLNLVNKNAIYSEDDCFQLMEKFIQTYYETRKIN